MSEEAEPVALRRHKFNVADKADRTWGGIVFDSKVEMLVAQALVLALPADTLIYAQSKFQLLPKVMETVGKKSKVIYRETSYCADFVIKKPDGEHYMVLDVKGMETPEFKLKAKLFWHVWKRHVTTVKSVKGLTLIDWKAFDLHPDTEIFTSIKKRKGLLDNINPNELTKRILDPTGKH